MKQTAPTKGQLAEVGKLAEGAAKDLDLTRDQVQINVLGRGGEVKAGFLEVLRKYGLPVNPYETERTKQVWFYPKGFTMPTLEVQAGRIKRVLGIELNWPDEAQNMPFATGEFEADGVALWPTLGSLGQLWSINDPRVRGYGEVIAATCNAINQSPDMAPLVNYRDGELDERYVRIHAEVMSKLVPLEDEAERQGFNALVMPVCLGDWRTGWCYSPRNARWQMLNLSPMRLAIEPVAGLSLLTGIKERLIAYEQLFCDFTGAEYNWGADGGWSDSLCADFSDGGFGFSARDADDAFDFSGAFAGFPGVSVLAA